jgi:hypothetical protein
MPLNIFKNKFDYVHENTFFRQLAIDLRSKYKDSAENVYLIGNPEIIDADGNRIAPDALFFTSKSFIIIDFKNYSGEIKLPALENFEFENWHHGSVIIKGGNQGNPYLQLRNHKEKIKDYLNYHKNTFLFKGSQFDYKHIDCIVCFLKEITVSGEIPEKYQNWFFIGDKNTIISSLDDIVTVKINLKPLDLERLASLFSITNWNPLEAEPKKIEESEIVTIEASQQVLNHEQLAALAKIESFLKNEKSNTFVLSGPFSSGKTFLINYLINRLPSTCITGAQVIAPNNRIARNIRKQIESVNNLYSYIYRFSEQVEMEVLDNIEEPTDSPENENEKESGQIQSKVIFKVKKNENPSNFLYIVDDSHHISDSMFASPTLQFGTGQLLSDLITFIKQNHIHFKILFVGDKNRLSIGPFEESALNPDYLSSKFELDVQSATIGLDPSKKSNIVKQALRISNQIELNRFNNLEILEAENIKLVKDDQFLSKALMQSFKEDTYQTKILAFSNDKIRESNLWVKQKVLLKSSELESGDIVLINNTVIVAPDNPFAVPQKVFNGEYAEILSVNKDIISINQPIRKKIVELKFRELKLKLIERNLNVTVLSFENYWNSTSKEITDEEYGGLQAYLNTKIRERIELEKETNDDWLEFKKSEQYRQLDETLKNLKLLVKLDGESRKKLNEITKELKKAENRFWKPKREESRREIGYHDKYINSVQLRFGYAITVHKAQSYRWNNIFFNLDQGDNKGTENKQYFKWVYTGIGCAAKKLFMINVPKITPYIKMLWKDNHECLKNSGKNIELFPFDSKSQLYEITIRPDYFQNTDDRLFSFYCWFENELSARRLSVAEVLHHEYAEHYVIRGNPGEEAIVIIWYNGKFEFKKHALANSTPPEFGKEVDSFLISLKTGKKTSLNLEFSSELVKDLFLLLVAELTKIMCRIEGIESLNYSERITFCRDTSFLTLDVFYTNEGFITTIYPIKCNNTDLYDDIKEVFMKIQNQHARHPSAS